MSLNIDLSPAVYSEKNMPPVTKVCPYVDRKCTQECLAYRDANGGMWYCTRLANECATGDSALRKLYRPK